MNESKIIFRTLIVFLLLILANPVKAQLIIEQIESEIPISYELIPEDVEFDEPEDEINFILTIPESKLKEAALSEGRKINKEKETIYIDGHNFAVETESEETGKVTMISDMKTGIIYYVMWSKKKVFEMKPEDMNKMMEKSKAASEKMLENLSPELRKQVMAEMEKEKNVSRIKYKAQQTGKKMKLFEFNCEEYRVSKDGNLIAIWASSDNSNILKEVDSVSNKFDELFKLDDAESVDEWQLVPGKIPVQVRTYTSGMMMGESVLTIQTITKIEKKKPSADRFRVPGIKDGFTTGSMMDMMMQMMPENE